VHLRPEPAPLVKDEKVTVEAALSASSNPHDFMLQLQQARIELPS
jgi:hypothetical protein